MEVENGTIKTIVGDGILVEDCVLKRLMTRNQCAKGGRLVNVTVSTVALPSGEYETLVFTKTGRDIPEFTRMTESWVEALQNHGYVDHELSISSTKYLARKIARDMDRRAPKAQYDK